MKATICLVMIVKDEAHIITETLQGVIDCANISYWVICDTGSTDGTQQLVKDFFAKAGIKGELLQHEWVDFDVNRTLAFEAAEGKANFMWVIDADDVPRGKFTIPKKMYKDKYVLNYRSATMTYVRPQLFKSGLNWKYVGVLHEYAESRNKIKPSQGKIEGDYYIESRRLGDRSLNPLKYYKDGIKLLDAYKKLSVEIKELKGTDKLKELEKQGNQEEIKKHKIYMECERTRFRLKKAEMLASRYTFYMGQSFRDFGDFEYSRKWYKVRGENTLRKFDEEAYQARMEVANIDVRNGATLKEVEASYLWAAASYPIAAEPYYKMACYFNAKEDYERGYKWAKKANGMPFPQKAQLFVQKDIYDFRAAKELGWAANKQEKYAESFNVIEESLNNDIPQHEVQFMVNIRNMNVEKLIEINKKYPAQIIKSLTQKRKTRGVTAVISFIDWNQCTACINSFLRCCKDAGLIREWIVYGDREEPNFEKLYPFVKYIVADEVDVPSLSSTEFTFYMDGRFLFLYETNYIQPNMDIMREEPDIKQVQLISNKTPIIEVNGLKVHNAIVDLDKPSLIKTKEIGQNSRAIARTWTSCCHAIMNKKE